MPYRLVYTYSMEWVGAGQGPMGVPSAQRLKFVNGDNGPLFGQNVPGAGAGGIINAADITTLTNAMAADAATQLNASIGQMQAWATGGG